MFLIICAIFSVGGYPAPTAYKLLLDRAAARPRGGVRSNATGYIHHDISRLPTRNPDSPKNQGSGKLLGPAASAQIWAVFLRDDLSPGPTISCCTSTHARSTTCSRSGRHACARPYQHIIAQRIDSPPVPRVNPQLRGSGRRSRGQRAICTSCACDSSRPPAWPGLRARPSSSHVWCAPAS